VIKWFKEKNVEIPLLQRNYKWSPATAAQLAYDLLNAYYEDKEREKALGFVTVYQEKENDHNFKILDGQQRIISLTILGNILKSNVLYSDDEKMKYQFARDARLPYEKQRKKCVEECLRCEELFNCPLFTNDEVSTDWKRLYRNYLSMLFPITVEVVLNNMNDEDKLKKEISKIDKGGIFNLTDNDYVEMAKLIVNNERINEICMKFKNIHFSITESYEANVIMDELNQIKKDLKIQVKAYKALDINKYLRERVFFYWNESTVPPISEFLSINQNKTAFVLYDYAKAKMILENEDENERKIILDNFAEISNRFYSNKECWDLVKRGYTSADNKRNISNEQFADIQNNEDIYKWEDEENRLKILFDIRYKNEQLYGFQVDYERNLIEYFKNIIMDLSNEDEKQKFLYNALWTIYLFNHKAFFVLLSEYYDNYVRTSLKTAEEIAKQEMAITVFEIAKNELEKSPDNTEKIWKQNYFYESIMHNEINTIFKLDSIITEESFSKSQEEWGYLEKDSEIINLLQELWVREI
jgi:hypothetical protein